MRLEAYLIEGHNSDDWKSAGRSVPIDLDEARNIIMTKCQNSMRSTQIYRGLENPAQALSIDPSKYSRKSEYANNYYMLLFQLMQSWKKYPNMSKSLIGVTSINDAKSWAGKTFVVYPYDGYDIGVCPYKHFWGSFGSILDVGQGMANLNDRIEDIFIDHEKIDQVKAIDDSETNPLVLKKAFDAIDKVKHSPKYYSEFKMFKNGEKLLTTFNRLLAPEKHGFQLINSGSKWNISDMLEIWTEAPCILINTDANSDFSKMSKKNYKAKVMKDLHSTP